MFTIRKEHAKWGKANNLLKLLTNDGELRYKFF